jgi:hypothetical protein
MEYRVCDLGVRGDSERATSPVRLFSIFLLPSLVF